MTENRKRFGTFSGVFVTNVLTIFGVILFYREGWMIGNAGLLGGLIIIILANSVTLTTALSISAISTNIKVKSGGSYFIISRSLGPEIGGAIGIALYFAQAFSISFYIIGFTLSLTGFFPWLDIRILNTLVLGVITIIALIDAGIAIKIQYVVLGSILLAILSFLAGNLGFHVTPQLFGSFENAHFWKTFAIFFPAVTGILAGVSLSGDLREPEKNIPQGTLLSVVFTFAIYILIAIFFAYNIPAEKLLHDENIMMSTAKIPVLILIGIWCATLSSALGSILAAPRTLQALAADRIVLNFFAHGSGKNNEPRRAVVITVLMAELLLLMGDINFVAQLLTMFFLATYGIINTIVTLEILIKNPQYRPAFKMHWIVSLYGAVASFIIMFLIHKAATILAVLIIVAIYLLLSRREYDINWGDIRKRLWASIIDIAVNNYEKYTEHPRNWKPNIAVFENDKEKRETLIKYSSLINGKNGIISYYTFMNTMIDAENYEELKTREEAELRAHLRNSGFTGIFPHIIMTQNDPNAQLFILQSGGIASYSSNTIMTDVSIEDKTLDAVIGAMSYYKILKKNLLLINHKNKDFFEDRIDIWLSGFKANLSLMLLIPFLIKNNREWQRSKIYLRMVVKDETLRESAETTLKGIVKNSRINLSYDIISLNSPVAEENGAAKKTEPRNSKLFPSLQYQGIFGRLTHFFAGVDQKRYDTSEREAILNIIKDRSKDAALVVLGLNEPEHGKEGEYTAFLKNFIKDLPSVILVKSNQPVNLFR